MARVVGFFIISLCVLFAYSPSLLHLPRSDQVIHLRHFALQQTLPELTLSNYDLNRKPQFSTGDSILFRPLLYVFLGLEKYCFGYHFLWWQATGVILHILVIFMFLNICWRLHPGWPSFAVTSFFALFYPIKEMVIWQHINGYLLALAFFLMALDQAIRLSQKEHNYANALKWMAVCLGLSVFMYEIVNIYAFLIFLYLWISRPDLKSKLFIILLPSAMYVCANLYNYYWVNHLAGKMPPAGFGIQITDFFQLVAWWLYSGVFFVLYPVYLGQRNGFAREDVLDFKLPNAADPVQIAGGLLLLAIFYLIISTRGALLKDRKNTVCLFLAFIGVHALVLVIFRGGNDLKGALMGTLYNQYAFWLFALLLFFACIDWKQAAGNAISSVISKTLIVLMLGYAFFSSQAVYEANYVQATMQRPSRGLIKKVEGLIKERGSETDFSFYVGPEVPGNEVFFYVMTAEGHLQKSRYMEMLYPQYFREKGAKFIFSSG